MSLAVQSETQPLQRGADAGSRRLAVAGIVAGVAVLLAGAGLLWARYGATVFFDLMNAGLAACL